MRAKVLKDALAMQSAMWASVPTWSLLAWEVRKPWRDDKVFLKPN